MCMNYQSVDVSKCVWFLAHWICEWECVRLCVWQTIDHDCLFTRATCLLKTQRDSVSMKARRQTDQLTCQDPLFSRANTIILSYPTHNNRHRATTALSSKVLWLLCALKHKHTVYPATWGDRDLLAAPLFNFINDPTAHLQMFFVPKVALMERIAAWGRMPVLQK